LAVTLTVGAMLIPVLAHGSGRGLGGLPAGVGMPDLPPMARGPADFPAARGSARDEPAADDTARGLGAAAAARRARARQLWRTDRGALDFDPEHRLIVRGEIAALAAAPAAIAGALARGFAIRRQQTLQGLGVGVTVLEVPRGLRLRRALQQLRAADPGGAYDYNHIYFESAAAPPGSAALTSTRNATVQPPANDAGTHPVGLIDGGVEIAHPAFRAVTVHAHGCGGATVPSLHGTEVASLLVGTGEEASVTPRSTQLYAADVYCGEPTGGAVDALVDALEWLVEERVAVINVSLVGPPNVLLERAIELATRHGYLIVAAVGNDGPGAPPLYPAAYPQVVAVTGVDRSDKVLLEAGRGTHVDFAALGADLFAASMPAGRAQVRGTSFAAPIVAALLAERLNHPDPALAAAALQDLRTTARDLGQRGFDPVYGSGLVEPDRPAVSAQATAAR
jgi:hypothetical protein